MILARVLGRVVAVRRAEGLEGEKFLLVQPLDEALAASGTALVACDVAQSGTGDLVHLVDGREAALALPERFVPVDATIVGHVEQVEGPYPSAGRKPGP
ncbi:MAG TPA: EutN/CcmL family microcompartment protein [Planctomycetota bacterium]|jgi:ethanolamine utilization protein EutN|nr:EutN/CcmL family microcompartment protein [Planctomycetota bacterium]